MKTIIITIIVFYSALAFTLNRKISPLKVDYSMNHNHNIYEMYSTSEEKRPFENPEKLIGVCDEISFKTAEQIYRSQVSAFGHILIMIAEIITLGSYTSIPMGPNEFAKPTEFTPGVLEIFENSHQGASRTGRYLDCRDAFFKDGKTTQ